MSSGPESQADEEVRRIAAELFPTFYDQLKLIAQRARARLGNNYTLQTTALVREAYLRLRQWAETRTNAFLRAAALAMRHALIDHATARLTDKRGGGEPHVALSTRNPWAWTQTKVLCSYTRRSGDSRSKCLAWLTWSSVDSSAAMARKTPPCPRSCLCVRYTRLAEGARLAIS